MDLVWTTSARTALLEAVAYIADDSPSAARRVMDDIERAASELKKLPMIGRPGRVEGTRELVVPQTQYILAYRVAVGAIVILHVLHSAQRWPDSF